MREFLEYAFCWTLLKALGALPGGPARRVGAGVGALAWRFIPRLRRTGLRNLQLAFPTKSEAERERILRDLYRSLGWQLAEFCQMAKYTRENTAAWIRYDGLERYLAARD